jgi:hypothetical protein
MPDMSQNILPALFPFLFPFFFSQFKPGGTPKIQQREGKKKTLLNSHAREFVAVRPKIENAQIPKSRSRVQNRWVSLNHLVLIQCRQRPMVVVVVVQSKSDIKENREARGDDGRVPKRAVRGMTSSCGEQITSCNVHTLAPLSVP